MNKIEKRMEELNYYAEVWGMSIEDTLAELLFNFYEAAGFDREVLAQELFSKSDEELMQYLIEYQYNDRPRNLNCYNKYIKNRGKHLEPKYGLRPTASAKAQKGN